MTARDLLKALRDQGIVLAARGDQLVARGRNLPPDLAARCRDLRATLVRVLVADAIDAATAADLRAIYESLSRDDRERLDAEAAGDPFAARVLAAVAAPHLEHAHV